MMEWADDNEYEKIIGDIFFVIPSIRVNWISVGNLQSAIDDTAVTRLTCDVLIGYTWRE